jgi:uncharacterized membrane protein
MCSGILFIAADFIFVKKILSKEFASLKSSNFVITSKYKDIHYLLSGWCFAFASLAMLLDISAGEIFSLIGFFSIGLVIAAHLTPSLLSEYYQFLQKNRWTFVNIYYEFLQKNCWTIVTILICFVFLLMPQLKLRSLHTTYYDLGLYAQQLSQFRGWDSNAPHSNYFFAFYSYIYQELPIIYSTKFLLLSQSLGLLFVSFIVYRLYGRTIAMFLVFSYPFWYANLFDFHFEFLSLIFLLCFFWSISKKKYFISVFFVVLMMLSKEVYALTAVMCGIYIIVEFLLSDERKNQKFILGNFFRYRPIIFGLSIIFISIIYFIHTLESTNLSEAAISSASTNFAYSNSVITTFNTYFSESFKQILQNPESIIWRVLFCILPILCFAGLPFLSPLPLIICLPTLLIAFFSVNPLHHSLNSHYSLILLGPLCLSSSKSLKKFNLKINRSWLITPIMIYFSISPGPLSYIFMSNMSWPYGFDAYIRNPRDQIIINAIEKNLQNNPHASVLAQNTVNSPLLYNRSLFNVFGKGFINDSGDHFDFIILDMKRPLFLADQSCKFRFGECRDAAFVEKFNQQFSLVSLHYSIKYQYDGFYIFQKNN